MVRIACCGTAWRREQSVAVTRHRFVTEIAMTCVGLLRDEFQIAEGSSASGLFPLEHFDMRPLSGLDSNAKDDPRRADIHTLYVSPSST